MGANEDFKKSMQDIAITGVSGRFPNCTNVEEFQEALFNGKDLITDNHNRWVHEVLETSPRLGLINDFEHFDASFFGINPKEANVYDPKLRKFIEVTFEAIVDAGLNPSELRGSQVGVFLAIGPKHVSDVNCKGGVMIQNPGIMPNIVSYAFGFEGPSVAINTACSSSFYAMTQAIDSILAGRCHTAIVGGVQHQYDPVESIDFLKLGVLHKEGICRVFDKNRKGYVKSEAVVAVVLQKVENSKRIYATVAGINIYGEGFKEGGFGHPSHLMQKKMYESVFENFGIDPLKVNYIETHGTGTIVGDAEEVKSIDEFYTKGRIRPLLIGSVKSNAGHAETAAGLVSLVKVIIAIRRGVIPANLHFHTPDPELKGIYEGRLKVVDYNTPLPEGLIAINCFGFGGANAILILNPYVVKKSVSNNLHYRLVQVSGRTNTGVEAMIKNIIKHKENEHFLSLVDAIYSKPVEKHNYRGYVVLSKESHYEIAESVSNKRPVWYVYAGFGSQWPGMAKDLMRVDVFRNTIQRCAGAVKPYGIDLTDVLVNGNEETFNDMAKTLPAITAVSVALTDVLTSLNVTPDGIIGHSLGEVGCAYADGLITPEEAVLLAFARGYAIMNSTLISGAMAVVGLSIEECRSILPKDVYIACDNSNRSVTISGPKETVTTFLDQLTNEGIYTKLINNANYALHCPHLVPASKVMLNIARTVLLKPKKRTNKWLSTAYDEKEWNSEKAKWNSADYHFDNFMNQVRFRQVLKYIPKYAIVIEIAPKGIFQGLLKRELCSTVTMMPLLKSNVDNLHFLLSNIGRFFIRGGNVDLQKFYPPVDFPVSVDTPMISSLIKWDHSIIWHSFQYNPESSFGMRFDIDIGNREFEFLEGHVVNGKISIPAAVYFVLVWKTFAKIVNTPYRQLPLRFDNIKIERPIFLLRNSPATLVVNILKTTGQFAISVPNSDQLIMTGNIERLEDCSPQAINCQNTTKDYPIISGDEFYDSMNLRGIKYSGIFRCIKQCSTDGMSAIVQWNDNWVALLDAVCQYVLNVETSKYCLPTTFGQVTINPLEHSEYTKISSDLLLTYDNISNSAKIGGIEIRKIHATKVKKHGVDPPPLLRKYTFVPNYERRNEDLVYSLTMATQIFIENCTENLNIKIGEIGSDECLKILKSSIEKVNLKRTQFQLVNSCDEISNFDLLITRGNENLNEYLNKAQFVFAVGCNFNYDNVEVIYRLDTTSKSLVLFRKSKRLPDSYKVITTNNNNYNWLLELKTAVKEYQSTNSRIYLISDDANSGIIGLFNTIRQERYCQNLRVFLIRNCDITFSLDSEFYRNQIRNDMTVNVYQNDTWGTYRLQILKPPKKILLNNAVLLKNNNGISWVQNSPHVTDDSVTICFASLNTNDLFVIRERSGYYKEQEHLGLEFSGFDQNGNKVMGLVSRGALGTFISPHPQLTWGIENKISLEEASTIPLVYTLSYYSLFIQVRLSSKDVVLVHNWSDGVSIAATALALGTGCEVYIVVSDVSFKTTIVNIFPKLEEDNIILHSQDNPFYKTVLQKNDQKGVNVIFNCKSEQLIRLSQECVSRNAKFVEVGDDSLDLPLNEALIKKNCSFYHIDTRDIFEESEEILRSVSEGVAHMIKAGEVLPLKYKVFNMEHIQDAINYFEENTIISKTVIKIERNHIYGCRRTYFDPCKSYIIVGGLGGLGFHLVDWFIERGATKIVLNSRSKISSGYHISRLNKWKKQGLTVVTNYSNTCTLDGAENLLNFASHIAPVEGIFNAALHNVDKFMSELSPKDFIAVAEPKIFSAQNLDYLSRKMCPHLNYFVLFSSLASSVGNPTQGNYAFVNSAIERLCETRRTDGLHGLAIEWGPLANVGILTRLKTNMQYLETKRQKLSSCLEVIDQCMQQSEPVVVSCIYGDDEDTTMSKKSFAELVGDLFGIKNVNGIEDCKTLLDLGMDSLLSFEVQHLLLKECGVERSINDIKKMTFENIRSYKSCS